MPATFTKTDRLLHRPEFEAVLDERKNVSDRRLMLSWRRNELGHARLGLVVSKAFGNAVKRNQFKRRIRDIFRRHRPETGVDIVVLPSRQGEAKTADHAAMLESWTALIERLLKKLAA
ncbi:MAG: ribonuclease P protein component [Planctomycetes bacterium]|nr:ribonuclease P protein component [Planctomycetota bacterium]